MEMTLSSRRELTTSIARRYRRSSKQAKAKILDEFCAGTGYNRDYAAELLRRTGTARQKRHEEKASTRKKYRKIRSRGGRPPKYGTEDFRVLNILWKRFDFLCGKRLVPLLRAVLPQLTGDPFLGITEKLIAHLSTMSPATVDRLLVAERKRYKLSGNSYTRSGESLKDLVPVRTFDEWNGCPPGHAQIDTVGHDGGRMSGDCSFTLCLTDVCTGWTERYAMQNRAFKWVHMGLDAFRDAIPFPILHLHPDGGSEFINHGLIDYCAKSVPPITLTRSRAGKKNDNCYVEQKNFDTVRKLVGYARYSTQEMLETLNELYRAHGLLINYFYPSQKLIEKTRVGSKVIKRYDSPQSPTARLLAHPDVPELVKAAARAMRDSLNPMQLAAKVDSLSKELRALLLGQGFSMTTMQDVP
jgi:hypothetical protein